MPIWLRNFTFNNIKTYYKELNEADKNSNLDNSKDKNIFGPDISPSYTTKASK